MYVYAYERKTHSKNLKMRRVIGLFVLIFVVQCGGTKPVAVRGRRGGQQLLLEGHVYTTQRRREAATSWLCTERFCGATITTRNENLTVTRRSPHNHPPDYVKCNARLAKSNMINSMMGNPDQSSYAVVRKQLSQLPPTVSSQLTSPENLARSMRYYRAKNRPPLPTKLSDLRVPQNMQQTRSNERFLLCDETVDDNRIIIFLSDFAFNFLSHAEVLCCDGTFSCTPMVFQQLFTINYFYGSKLLPAVFALCQHKNAATYSRIFAKLVEISAQKCIWLKPRKIVCDFEKALIKVASEAFPAAKVQGCYFHFCQAVYRKIQKLGLADTYMKHDRFRTFVRCLMALGFLPVDEVSQSFIIIDLFLHR